MTFDPSAAWSPVEKPEESRGDEGTGSFVECQCGDYHDWLHPPLLFSVNTPPRKKVNVDSSPVPSGEMSDNRLPASNIPNSQVIS